MFWVANASELLHAGRADACLARAVGPALLAELAQLVHNMHVLHADACRARLLSAGIRPAVAHWMQQHAAAVPVHAAQQASASLVAALDDCLRAARWALLNPALTIQLFSQLFHFISATIFNWMVTTPGLNLEGGRGETWVRLGIMAVIGEYGACMRD